MTKEAYYFSHDSNARQDDKIVALRMKHGWEGYGLFWAIIEKLRDASDFSCVKDYNLIAFDLRTDSQKIKSIIEDFNLFEIQDDRFFSCSLIERMSKREKSSLSGIKGNLIKYGHAKKEDLEKMSDIQIIELNNNLKSPRVRPEFTPSRIINESKEKKSKVNKSKLNTPIIPFGNEQENLFPEGKKDEPSEQVKTGSEEKEKSSAKKEKEIIDCFHENCSGLPKIQVLTKARKKSINARISDYGIEKVKEVIKLAGESKFLAGNNRNEWTADFDWILKPTNFVKILEGNYKDKDFNNGKSNNQTGTAGNNTPAQQATYNIQEAAGRLAEDFAKGNIPGVYR